MKLVCIQSRINDFTVGSIYHDATRETYSGNKERNVIGNKLGRWILNNGGLQVRGVYSSIPMATFEPAPTKSLRKMMVRAFVKYAKDRGWGDSKNGARYSWSGNAFNNANDWARNWADGYFCNDGTPIEAFAEHFEPGQQITQHDIDGYVDEEMSYL